MQYDILFLAAADSPSQTFPAYGECVVWEMVTAQNN